MPPTVAPPLPMTMRPNPTSVKADPGLGNTGRGGIHSFSSSIPPYGFAYPGGSDSVAMRGIGGKNFDITDGSVFNSRRDGGREFDVGRGGGGGTSSVLNRGYRGRNHGFGGGGGRGFVVGRGVGGRGREFHGGTGEVLGHGDRGRNQGLGNRGDGGHERGRVSNGKSRDDLDNIILHRQDFHNLPPFQKNFYVEHPAVQALSEQEIMVYRRSREITVEGINVPKPLRFFHEANFPGTLSNFINLIIFIS